MKTKLKYSGISPRELEASTADRSAWRSLTSRAAAAFEEDRPQRLDAARGRRHRAASASTRTTVCLLVGCLTSQPHASVSQGRICTDNFTCCHTEIEAADQTFHLTQSQYTDTGPTSPSADPIMPGAWQGSHWSANF